tara:strand:+ start:7184 stop:8491 length:1308 start_codon:yes stop_codon:yes gene_type:complete
MNNFLTSQVNKYIEPLSFEYQNNVTSNIAHQKEEHKMKCQNINNNKKICTVKINSLFKNKRYKIIGNGQNENDRLFIKHEKNWAGPYFFNNNVIETNPIQDESIIIEINSTSKNDITIYLEEINNDSKIENKTTKNIYFKSKQRENPTILVTGYWPPTNEMIRHFSQDTNLNPNGWQGENWENRGYDIISYFPEFNPPDCSSCGEGYGILQVDYQNTSEDFWPIFGNKNPIGIITFSRGYMDQSWELEYNAYNRTNWYNDYNTPFQPTPNPPDENEQAYFLRNSNLPMNNIIEAINTLNIGLNPYIDSNGDPGRFVSEFMAYHGTWYRDLNQLGENNCISAGHIHVGGNIEWDTAKIAAEESIRVLINHLDQFTYLLGDINQDDIIDVLDLVTCVNYILGTIELNNQQTLAADMNEDTIINIQDIILLINNILNS